VTRVAHRKRRDLAPLRHLPRSVALNYLRQARAATAGGSAALLKALVGYAHGRLGPRAAFADYPRGPGEHGIYRLGGERDAVRVSIAGDWASGTDEADAVAVAMAAASPHFTIHLGDIYYVGDEAEVRSSMLGEPASAYPPTLWPRGATGTFALNGNHEMYARGAAYFGVLLPRLGLAAGGAQRASFFCLQNPHWRILALDTAYCSVGWPLFEELPFAPFAASNGLTAAQLRWLDECVRPEEDSRGLLILTHHPPWSRGRPSTAARQLRRRIRRPALWLFGHEHRLAIYDRYDCGGGLLVSGRNVGHGGMPVELSCAPAAAGAPPVLFTDLRRYPNDEGLELGYNGYADLTFAGPELTIDYRDLNGAAVYREQWRVSEGRLAGVC